MKDMIIDYESDGTPVHLIDLMAKVGEYALKLGMQLQVSEDPLTGQERFWLVEIEPGAIDRIDRETIEETWRRLDPDGDGEI